jgi:hypothetical protein
VQVNEAIVVHINREPPPRAKPKGRSIPESEKREISLGAKGPKKGTRRCSSCGYFATHNSRTCLKLKHNKARLEEMQSRTRGRPRGAQNKCSDTQHGNGGEKHKVPQSTIDKELPTETFTIVDSESDSEEFEDMDMEE